MPNITITKIIQLNYYYCYVLIIIKLLYKTLRFIFFFPSYTC
jgi:hypothetical protein